MFSFSESPKRINTVTFSMVQGSGNTWQDPENTDTLMNVGNIKIIDDLTLI